ARAGVELRCGVGVTALQGDGRVERVVLADGSVLPADLVVVGTGAVPSTGWLEGSGLVLSDGVVCDATLQAAPGVWAAGDVARWPNPPSGALVRLEHWTSAAEQGTHAGRAAAGEDVGAFSTVPYAWSDVYGRKLQAVGHTGGDDVRVVGDADRWVALYRGGDRLVGAFLVDLPGRTMKLRRLIASEGSWEQALELVAA
ncbi:MAG: FAD-dependent pyridine nucleotide-disulfide oxidoreductase, partial [Frankiales bacterium]|nr:FAD-dependent pyridine nucleotide-disulfide oxidoreductase [Frankiales bacterium]